MPLPADQLPPGRDWLVQQVRTLRRELDELRAARSADATSIGARGRLELTDGNGNRRLLIGGSTTIPMPDGSPQPVFAVYDATNRLRLAVYDPNPSDGYDPVFWVYDHLGRVAFTTDRAGGVAEPWIPVPLSPAFHDSQFADSTNTDPTLPVSACTGGTVWEGRIGKVSHPRIQLDGTFGRVTGTTGTPTYRLLVSGAELGSWTQTAYAPTVHGPFDITPWLGRTNITVRLTLSATGTGTDRVACNVLGCWLRQTDA